MTSRDDVMKRIRDVEPAYVEAYLRASGWEHDGDVGELASIWHRPAGQAPDAEVLLPHSHNLRDYVDRMADAVLAIASFEERSPLVVLNETVGYSADFIRIRVTHPDVAGGTIPLKDGVQLNQHARDLMAAAAMSTASRRRHFTAKRSHVARAFLESLRLGQTEVGSYVVNIIAPVTAELTAQLDLPTVPLASVVTDHLSMSLVALNDAIEWYERTLDLATLDPAVESGASANLCDALVGLSGQEKQRAVEITLVPALSQAPRRTTRTFTFDAEKMGHLEIASKYYKDNYVAENQTIRGTIQRLDRALEEENGTITVEAKIRNTNKHVTIDLNPDEYLDAIEAHRMKDDVQCTGDLHVTARKARLLNPRGFTVLTSGNLFREPKDPA